MNSSIALGAEAVITRKGQVLLKDRKPKRYRHRDLDTRIRFMRTRQEARMLTRLQALRFSSPSLVSCRDALLEMDFVPGKKLSDFLSHADYLKIASEIGEKVAFLHDHHIIHGDLTTSNMILGKEVIFIDFGLSFISSRVEDRAVDIHLFRQALASRHHAISEACFKAFRNAYLRTCRDGKDVLERLAAVEQRGRYKTKI